MVFNPDEDMINQERVLMTFGNSSIIPLTTCIIYDILIMLKGYKTLTNIERGTIMTNVQNTNEKEIAYQEALKASHEAEAKYYEDKYDSSMYAMLEAWEAESEAFEALKQK